MYLIFTHHLPVWDYKVRGELDIRREHHLSNFIKYITKSLGKQNEKQLF